MLNKVLLDTSFGTIIVENKDRLTRFGFNYIKNLLETQNRHVIVMNDKSETEADLMQDFISIITSFCCRIYGLRRMKNKLDKIKKILRNKNE
jgi:predicted site-specific integrase-resolvase